MGNILEHYNSELYHYGVKGMKWGVRRYQNPDGTLTAKGRQKYITITNHEDFARYSSNSFNRKRVMAKYENKKTAEQKQADRNLQKARDEYDAYVTNYRKSNKDVQTKYEHDYDHTKKGQALIDKYVEANEVRERAYSGASWLGKYAKELQKASLKDYREEARRGRGWMS